MKSLLAASALVLIVGSCAGAGMGGSTTTTGPVTPTSGPVTPTTSTTSPAPTSTTAPTTTSTTALATTSTTTGEPLAGRTVVLDPGHNGMNWAHPEEINRQVDIGTGVKACNTTGTSTEDGYAEASFTWEVAQRTVPLLEALGATVLLTRSDNEGWGPCITERAALGNEAGADVAISIHADGGAAEGRGFHVIYPPVVDGLTEDIAEDSRRLAETLHAAYQATGMPIADYIADGGFSVRDDLGGLTLSDVPVVFLEAGNMRNVEDAALLGDADFQQLIAEAITEAVVTFLETTP